VQEDVLDEEDVDVGGTEDAVGPKDGRDWVLVEGEGSDTDGVSGDGGEAPITSDRIVRNLQSGGISPSHLSFLCSQIGGSLPQSPVVSRSPDHVDFSYTVLSSAGESPSRRVLNFNTSLSFQGDEPGCVPLSQFSSILACFAGDPACRNIDVMQFPVALTVRGIVSHLPYRRHYIILVAAKTPDGRELHLRFFDSTMNPLGLTGVRRAVDRMVRQLTDDGRAQVQALFGLQDGFVIPRLPLAAFSRVQPVLGDKRCGIYVASAMAVVTAACLGGVSLTPATLVSLIQAEHRLVREMRVVDGLSLRFGLPPLEAEPTALRAFITECVHWDSDDLAARCAAGVAAHEARRPSASAMGCGFPLLRQWGRRRVPVHTVSLSYWSVLRSMDDAPVSIRNWFAKMLLVSLMVEALRVRPEGDDCITLPQTGLLYCLLQHCFPALDVSAAATPDGISVVDLSRAIASLAPGSAAEGVDPAGGAAAVESVADPVDPPASTAGAVRLGIS
jgi:hypothetical protein